MVASGGVACFALKIVVGASVPTFHSSPNEIDPGRASIPDVQPPRPIIEVLAGRRLFQEVAWKEVTVFREPAQVAGHLPVRLGGSLRGDIARVTVQARNDYRTADVVQPVCCALAPEKSGIECERNGVREFKSG